MNDDIDAEFDNDLDEQLLRAYQQYFYYNDRFIRHGYHTCSIKARKYLKLMKVLAEKRRKEILNQRKSVEKK